MQHVAIKDIKLSLSNLKYTQYCVYFSVYALGLSGCLELVLVGVELQAPSTPFS